MAGINRGTTGVQLPVAVSNEIWGAVAERSVVQQLAQQTPLPGSGVAVHVVTGDPVAAFTAEGAEKPVSASTLDNKIMRPYTLSVIEYFSNQFRRDLPTVYNSLVGRLPGAIALAFDKAALHGTGAPSGDFSTLALSPTQALTANSIYTNLLTAMGTVNAYMDSDANGIAASPALEALLLGELDANDRPLFAPAADAPAGRIGSVLGRPVVKGRGVFNAATTPDTLGVVGDWSKAFWGQVSGIQIAIADQATLNDGGTSINLFQRNMFAVRCEVEVGFVVQNDDAFVRLTAAA